MRRGPGAAVDDAARAALELTAAREPAPSRNDEYLVYQTLLGSFPEGARGDALAAYRELLPVFVGLARDQSRLHIRFPVEAGSGRAPVLKPHLVQGMAVLAVQQRAERPPRERDRR